MVIFFFWGEVSDVFVWGLCFGFWRLFFFGGGLEKMGKNEGDVFFFPDISGGVDGQGEWCDEVLEKSALDILVDMGNFTLDRLKQREQQKMRIF